MKKSNIKNIFKDIDIDVAKSNSITVQTKFSLCDEQHIILNETMKHLTNCFFSDFPHCSTPAGMTKSDCLLNRVYEI